MKASSFTLTTTCLLFFTLFARAHGPQIQITDTNNQIVTRNLFVDAPYDTVLTNPTSVYVMPLNLENGEYYIQPNNVPDPDSGSIFFSGPGIAFGMGLTFTPGYQFNMTLTSGLQLWNGSGWTDAGPTQIEAFRGSESGPTAEAISSDSGPSSLNFSTFTAAGYNTGIHADAYYVLLGDGNSPLASSPDGVYLLSLQLSSTQPGLAPSDPFYYVLYKNVPQSEAIAAANSLGIDQSMIQVVPEVGSLSLMGLSGLVVAGVGFLRKQKTHSSL